MKTNEATVSTSKKSNRKNAGQKTKSQFDVNPVPVQSTGSATAETPIPANVPPVTTELPPVAETIAAPVPVANTAPVQDGNAIVIPGIHMRDKMTSVPGAMWHTHRTEQQTISLRNPEQCALAAWDVKAERLLLPGGIDAGLSMLVCTDDGKPIGKDYFDKDKNKMIFKRQAFNPDTYFPLCNSEFLGVVEQILSALDKTGVKYEIATTGSVENRNRVFISIRIMENASFKIGEREFLAFIDCLNSFNKSCNVTFTNSNICVCCANTFRMALHDDTGAFKVSIPHRKNMRAVLSDVPRLIELAFKGNENFKNHLSRWADFGIGATEAQNIFAAFIGDGDEETALSTRSSNQVEKLVELFKKGKGNKGETVLDAFQAATEYYTHFSAGDSDDTMKQFESSEFGNGADKKTEFFDCLIGATESKEKFIGVARIGERILIATDKAQKAKQADKAKAKLAAAQAELNKATQAAQGATDASATGEATK